MKRSRIGAIVGAGMLALTTANVAMAVVLIQDHQALIAGWDADGDPFAHDAEGGDYAINGPKCDGIAVEADEIVFLFEQTGLQGDDVVPNPGGGAANTLDVDLNDGEIFLEDLPASDVQAASVSWQVTVNPPGDELELVSANSNVDGGELVVAAICFASNMEPPDTSTLGAPQATTAAPAWLLVVVLALLALSVVAVGPSRPRSRD